MTLPNGTKLSDGGVIMGTSPKPSIRHSPGLYYAVRYRGRPTEFVLTSDLEAKVLKQITVQK